MTADTTATDNPTPEQLAARERWVALLREGKYKKMKGFLASASGKSRCCLGVACDPIVTGLDLEVETVPPTRYEPARQRIGGWEAFLPREVRDALGFHRLPLAVALDQARAGWDVGDRIDLAELNDHPSNIPHRVLADLIEAEYITPHKQNGVCK